MRDVNAGWLIRYIHANGASFFFVCLYLHIAKALYYGDVIYIIFNILVFSSLKSNCRHFILFVKMSYLDI